MNKNSDGSGKFVYDLTDYTVPNKDTKHRNSELGTITVFANESTSSNYIVKSVSVTVKEKAVPWEVTGTTKDTVTAAASSGAALVIDLSTFTYANQWGGDVAYKNVSGACLSYLIEDNSGVFAPASGSATKVNEAATAGALTGGKKIELKAVANKGTAYLYLKYINPDSKVGAVTNETFDQKIQISVVDGQSIDISNVRIDSINDGNEVYGADAVTFVASAGAVATTGSSVDVVVKANVNGKNVVLQPSQYKILNPIVAGLGAHTAQNDKSETRTLTVVVMSENGDLEVSKEYTFSNKPVVVKAIKAADSTDVSGAENMSKTELIATIKLISQYGTDVTSAKGDDVIYKINFTGGNAADAKVNHNSTQEPAITLENATSADHTATIVYRVGFGETAIIFEQSVKFTKTA